MCIRDSLGEPHWIPRRLFTGLMILFIVTTVGERMVLSLIHI